MTESISGIAAIFAEPDVHIKFQVGSEQRNDSFLEINRNPNPITT